MLLFSATVPYWVREVADKYMSHDRIVMDLFGEKSLKTAVSVEHKAICCPYAERPSTIADVIQVRLKTQIRMVKSLKEIGLICQYFINCKHQRMNSTIESSRHSIKYIV